MRRAIHRHALNRIARIRRDGETLARAGIDRHRAGRRNRAACPCRRRNRVGHGRRQHKRGRDGVRGGDIRKRVGANCAL